MSYTGTQPATKATWKQRDGVVSSDTTTLNVAGGYMVGYLSVYIEGRKLNQSDFTATDGATVVFPQTLPAGTNYMFELIEPVQYYNNISVSATEPANPNVDDIWFDIS